MIPMDDAASTRKTDEAATQRKMRFVKLPDFQRLHSALSNISRIRTLTLAACLVMSALSPALAFASGVTTRTWTDRAASGSRT
jgi:hypothetical protein